MERSDSDGASATTSTDERAGATLVLDVYSVWVNVVSVVWSTSFRVKPSSVAGAVPVAGAAAAQVTLAVTTSPGWMAIFVAGRNWAAPGYISYQAS